MHKNISSKTPGARLNVVFSNSDCGINQFQGIDSVGPDPKHTQRSNKILFEHDLSFFLAYSDCLTSFRDIGLQNIDKGRQVAGLLSTSSRQLKYSHKTIK